MKLPRFTVRRLMVAVAVVGITMGTVRLMTELRYATLQNGWNTSVFPIGQRVTTYQEIRIEGITLTAGTRGIVTGDPPDDDSAYPDRLVGVKIIEGQHQGITQAIQRRFLRAE
jgi:hypothetical protein